MNERRGFLQVCLGLLMAPLLPFQKKLPVSAPSGSLEAVMGSWHSRVAVWGTIERRLSGGGFTFLFKYPGKEWWCYRLVYDPRKLMRWEDNGLPKTECKYLVLRDEIIAMTDGPMFAFSPIAGHCPIYHD